MTRFQNGGPGFRARGARMAPLYGLILTAAIGACTVDGLGTDPKKLGAAGLTPTPAPATKASGTGSESNAPGTIGGDGSANPTPTAAASAATSPSPLPAGVGVSRVELEPTSVKLNVPAADGVTTAQLESSQQFVATVKLSPTGQNAQVNWTVSDAVNVKVTPIVSGRVTVSVEPGAPVGEVILTAAAKQDETKIATASILITRDSQLSFEIK